MRPRKTLVAALAAVAVMALVFAISHTEIGRIFEFKTLDFRFQSRPTEAIDPNLLVIGDEVNLGARLESLTRQHDANIIVSESTYREIKELVITRELGEVTVRGRLQPVQIYSVDGLKNKV